MVYESIIGLDFHKLHPMLKERYSLKLGETFKSQGVMEVMKTKPHILKPIYRMLSKLKFIVPESGESIAFDMQYTLTHYDEKTAIFKWVRTFYFPEQTYEFHTRMVVDFETGVVKDYMGSPSVVNSHLTFDVTEEEAQARIASQLPLSVKEAGADAIIYNNNSLASTAVQLEKILKEWHIIE